MPYPNVFASLAGDQPASKLDENFNAAQLLTGKNAASGYVGLDASSNASIAGALQVTGNINLGGQVISTGPVTASPVFIATSTAGSVRGYTMRTGTSNRWILETDGTAESGSNAGSDLEVARFDDAGAFIDSPLIIKRATGVLTVADGLAVAGSGLINDSGIGTPRLQATGIQGSYAAAAFFMDSASAPYIGFIGAGVRGGSVSGNGSGAVLYLTTSDHRLKENLEPVDQALAARRLMDAKYYMGDWKSAPERPKELMVIAHEWAEVMPEAVIGARDAVDDSGTPIYQSVDHSKAALLLGPALQFALNRIADLEARLAVLEP